MANMETSTIFSLIYIHIPFWDKARKKESLYKRNTSLAKLCVYTPRYFIFWRMSTEQVCTPKLSDFWGGIRMANGIYINRINCIFHAHMYTDERKRRLMSDSFSFVNTIPASLCAPVVHKFKDKTTNVYKILSFKSSTFKARVGVCNRVKGKLNLNERSRFSLLHEAADVVLIISWNQRATVHEHGSRNQSESNSSEEYKNI